MKIQIDKHRCVGAGQCALYAPDLFGQDEEDGLIVVHRVNIGPEDREQADAAMLACPTATITVIDD